MKNIGYYNGKTGALEELQIPMLDRACYFGDGVYDATYSANGVIWTVDEHIDRFYRSAALLEIKPQHSKAELKALLQSLVDKVGKGVLFVYWQLTRGTALRRHVFPDAPSNLWVMIMPQPLTDNFTPIKLITLEDTRFFHCNIKTLNLIPSVMANEKAKRAGCQEAVFHRAGRVTECAHSNISIIKNGIFRTAPADELILGGIARAHLIKKCHELGIPVDESPFYLEDLFNADEAIVSSCGTFCCPVCEIDGKRVCGKAPEILGKLRAALIEEFKAATGSSAADAPGTSAGGGGSGVGCRIGVAA